MVGEIFEIPRCEIAKNRHKAQNIKKIYVVEISKRRLGAKKKTKSRPKKPKSLLKQTTVATLLNGLPHIE